MGEDFSSAIVKIWNADSKVVALDLGGLCTMLVVNFVAAFVSLGGGRARTYDATIRFALFPKAASISVPLFSVIHVSKRLHLCFQFSFSTSLGLRISIIG